MAGILSEAARALADGALGMLPLSLRDLEEEVREKLAQAPLQLNEYGYDPYGFNPQYASRVLLPTALLYRYYFRVDTFDIDRVPDGRMLLIGNHSGQFAYDGAMLGLAMLLEAQPPRLTRGMGEYFLWKVPWMGLTAARTGTMVGTPENCISMLQAEECVMAFPEGARGANKPFHKRYQLQRFGQGFMRLALQTRTPIVPVGIVGAEEQQPGLANLEGVGRALGLPSLPITVTSPWFGLLGTAMALPTKYRIYFGEPLYFEGDANEEDDAIQRRVEVVKESMRKLLDRGLRERTGIFS
jgi:1-acyl-sn-glycerol-3-phosphate acyltransferase